MIDDQQEGAEDRAFLQALQQAEDSTGSYTSEDAELDAQLSQAMGTGRDTHVAPSARARMGKWYRNTRDVVAGTPAAVMRGAAKGVDEMSNSVVGLGLGISKTTGLYKIGADEQEEQDFVNWYENASVDEMNPFQIGEERRRNIFGADEGGVLGFVEGMAQFGVGMIGVSKFVKPLQIAGKVGQVAALGRAAGAVGTMAESAVAGLAADMTAFDPHADRISNMVENGPEWLSNPVTRYLQNEVDDGELESRLKAGMEGLIIGSTIDGIVTGVKMYKVWKAWKAGKVTEDVAKTQVADIAAKAEEAAAARPKVDEVVVEQAEDAEEWLPVLVKADGTRVVDPEAPRFKTPGEAENHAAAVNVSLANERLDRSKASPEFIDQWRRLSEAPDERTYKQILAETGMNVRWDLSSDEILGQMKAAIDVDPTFQHMMRNGERRTWAEAQKLVNEILPGMNPQTVMENAAKVFNQTENLDVALLGLKRMTDIMGATVNKLNNVAQANPANPVAFDNLARALDSFIEIEGYFAGAKSNTARGLAILRKKTGGKVDEALALEMADRDFADAAATDPKVQEIVDALDEVQQAKERHSQVVKLNDTDAVTASEVQLSRVYDKVKRLVDQGDKAKQNAAGSEAKAESKARASDIKSKAAAADEAGLTTTSAVGSPESQAAENPVMDLASLIDQAETSLTKQLDQARQNARKNAGQVKSSVKDMRREANSPLSDHLAADKARKASDAADGVERPGVDDLQGPKQLSTTSPGFSRSERAPRTYKATEGLTKREILALSRQIMAADGQAGQILLALRAPRRPVRVPVEDKAWKRFFINYRINAMLSGPKTLLTNAINNTVVAVQMPLEMYWAGKRSGNQAMKQQGWDTLMGLTEYYKESWAMAKKAWQIGENILDSPRPEIGMNTTLSATDDIKGVKGALGAIFQAPTRFLMATDEFFKQLNYRANMKGQILRQAREQGITDPTALAARLADDMNFSVDAYGGAVNPTALQWSRTATFTNDLEYGIGKWLQDGAIQHPAIRFIMPFVRTPVNIFRFSMQRTPALARFTRQYKEALASGHPEQIALVKAREEFGMMVMGTAALWASLGDITGAGPTDPELRRQLKDTGWQPYSVRIPGTNQYVSYRRGDPSTALFGVMADIIQVSSELDDDELLQPMYAGVAAVMSNVTSKTFMQGVSGFLEAVSSGRGDLVENFVTNSVGSFVPNVLRQVDPSDEVKETRGMVDELMARVPGFSNTLEARRNLLGEKVLRPPGYFNRTINPFTVAPGVADDDVLMQLTKLGEATGNGAFTMPLEQMENGAIDLTDRSIHDNGTGQSPYDRMQQILLPPSQGGILDLRGELARAMSTPEWKESTDTIRYQIAQEIIVSLQESAKNIVVGEYESLQQALGQAKQYNATKAASGKQSAKDAVLQSYENIFIRMK